MVYVGWVGNNTGDYGTPNPWTGDTRSTTRCSMVRIVCS